MTNKKNPDVMRFIFITILFIILLIMVEFFSTPPLIIMSYFVPEDNHNKQFRDKLDRLNVIAYAFLHANQDGAVILQGSAEADLKRFSSLNNQQTRLKKIVSIGGADDKTSFFYAIKNPDHFVNSISKVIDHYKLSGLDLDFEIDRLFTPEEANGYVELIDQLRKKLGPKKLLSMTTIIDQATLQSMGRDNWSNISNHVNFVSMMCYDFISPVSQPPYTAIASNLYPIKTAPRLLPNANSSCDQSITYLTMLGMPVSKIILGIPAYAVAYGGVTPENDGLFQPFNPAQTPVFDNMGQGLLRYSTVLHLNKKGFKEHTIMSNGDINGVWSYNQDKRQFITYDNPDSIRNKIHYILKKKLAGVMMWRVGQDVPIDHAQSLLKAIVNTISNKDRSQTELYSEMRS